MAKEPKIVRGLIWPLDKIKEYEHNPKKHPEEQIDLLAELIKKWGPDQDIVVDEKGVILKGHGRKLAAAKAGRKDFPVTQRFGLSESEKTAIRIADNQIPLLGSWDKDLVAFEIKRLERDGFDMKLLGFGEAQLVQFTTTPGPPAGGFAAFDEGIPVEHQCPKCGYVWSGTSAPKPKPEKTGVAAKRKAGLKARAAKKSEKKK